MDVKRLLVLGSQRTNYYQLFKGTHITLELPPTSQAQKRLPTKHLVAEESEAATHKEGTDTAGQTTKEQQETKQKKHKKSTKDAKDKEKETRTEEEEKKEADATRQRRYRLEVEQCTWDDISVVSYADNGGLVVTIRPSFRPLAGTPQDQPRAFQPDFVLLRASCKGGAAVNHMHLLAPFCHADVPSLNEWPSFYLSQDKAAMYGRLLRVKRRLGGAKEFPLVQQACYSDWKAATFPPDFPCVAKIGTASGGLGKMKINGPSEWDDFGSVSAMQPQFFTSEPFVKWEYDVRIQKIGPHIRAMKRTSKHWKSNVDIAMIDEDIEEVPERYRRWINAAAKECGMDICAMDVLTTTDGKEYILELNSSAIGLSTLHAEEDELLIRDLTLRRMESALQKRLWRKEEDGDDESHSTPTEVEELQQEVKQLRARLKEMEEREKDAAQKTKTKNSKKNRLWG
ncbi:Synapsin, ATP binding domain containing protein [Balamuthia mandrillaris]